jgi:hypothetical protein
MISGVPEAAVVADIDPIFADLAVASGFPRPRYSRVGPSQPARGSVT